MSQPRSDAQEELELEAALAASLQFNTPAQASGVLASASRRDQGLAASSQLSIGGQPGPSIEAAEPQSATTAADPMQQQAPPAQLAHVLSHVLPNLVPHMLPNMTPADRLALFCTSKDLAVAVVRGTKSIELRVRADAGMPFYPSELLASMLGPVKPETVALSLSGGQVVPHTLRPYITDLNLQAGFGPPPGPPTKQFGGEARQLQRLLPHLPRLRKLGLASWDLREDVEEVTPLPVLHGLELINCTLREEVSGHVGTALCLVDTTQLQSLTVCHCTSSTLAEHLPRLPALKRVGFSNHEGGGSAMVDRLINHMTVRELVIDNPPRYSHLWRDYSQSPCTWDALHLHPATTDALLRLPLPRIPCTTLHGNLSVGSTLEQCAAVAERCPKLVCVATVDAGVIARRLPPQFCPAAFELHWHDYDDGLCGSEHLPGLISACTRHLVGAFVLSRVQVTGTVLASLAACPRSISMLGFRCCRFSCGQGGGDMVYRDLVTQHLPDHIVRVAFWGEGQLQVFSRQPGSNNTIAGEWQEGVTVPFDEWVQGPLSDLQQARSEVVKRVDKADLLALLRCSKDLASTVVQSHRLKVYPTIGTCTAQLLAGMKPSSLELVMASGQRIPPALKSLITHLTMQDADVVRHLTPLRALHSVCLANGQAAATTPVLTTLMLYTPIKEVVIHDPPTHGSLGSLAQHPCSWRALHLHPANDHALLSLPLAQIKCTTLHGNLSITNSELLQQCAAVVKRCRRNLVCEPAAPAAGATALPAQFAASAFQLLLPDHGQVSSTYLPRLISVCTRHLVGAFVLSRVHVTPAVLASLAACPSSVSMLGFRCCRLSCGQGRGDMAYSDLVRHVPDHIVRVAFWEEGQLHVFSRPLQAGGGGIPGQWQQDAAVLWPGGQ